MPPFTFAVIADSHFQTDGFVARSAYPSDALHNDRNRAVVQLINAAAPTFVIHLGDVPHPVPGLAAHAEALATAQATYAPLRMPLHVVPGNHDVGDKPHAWLPAPGVDDAKHAVFRAHWGAPWRSFDHEGCHFVLIDTPVMGSGLAIEAEQWAWLEADLAAAAGRRTFCFLHYPLYLLEPDEPVHYDNLALPVRLRLLDLFERHSVEAAFSGHAHHFFYDRHRGTDLYVAPATSFVRPGFTELGRIGPVDEFGRNDVGRLGFFFVHVGEEGHHVESVRTDGATNAGETLAALRPGAGAAPPCPFGVTLRHAWDHVYDIPCDNLDPFRRKEARDDRVLQATWDVGLRALRLPADDLRRAATRRRLGVLRERGQRATVFLAGRPDAATWALLAEHRDLVDAVELVVARTALAGLLDDAPAERPPVELSVMGKVGPSDDVYFSHFPQPGFDPGDRELAALPAGIDAVVFRVLPDAPVGESVREAVRATPTGLRCAVQVWVPRAGEGSLAGDDAAVARRVLETWAAAHAWPAVSITLDTFVDHDRGYYPRHGLLDRRSDPRPAWWVLRNLGRLFPAPTGVEKRDGTVFVTGPEGSAAVYPGGVVPAGGGVDLVGGLPLAAGVRAMFPFVTTNTLHAADVTPD